MKSVIPQSFDSYLARWQRFAKDHEDACVAIFLVFFTVIFSYPLIWNMGEILTGSPGEPTDLDVFDFRIFLDSIHHMRALWLAGKPILSGVVTHTFSPSLSYTFLGVALTFFMPTIVAHNVMMLVAIFLAGFFMFKLAKRFSSDSLACLYAAINFASCRYILIHLLQGHPNQVQIFWLPLIFLILEITLQEGPRLREAFWLGLSFGLLLLSNDHFSVYMILILPFYTLLRLPRNFKIKQYLPYLLTFLLVLGVVAGYVSYFRLKAEGYHYSLADNMYFSMHLGDILAYNKESNLGIFPLTLSLLGLLFALMKREKPMLVLAALAFTATLLALGPFHPWAPYRALFDFVPLFDRMRTPIRMVVFLLLAASCMSAYGFAWLRNYVAASSTRYLSLVITLVLFGLTLRYNHFRAQLFAHKLVFSSSSTP